ncbi:MAG: hypothetical protein HXX81_07355 [Campylobacterales bacterium]|nr:hypothetical protein [Campylobacterales bacterium]
MMISEELNGVLNKAINFAKAKRHEYITIEHVFLALLTNDDCIEIIKHMSLNLNVLKSELHQYIVTNYEPLDGNFDFRPAETVALNRVIDSMLERVKSSEKKMAEVSDMLAAILEEEQSFSAF